MASQTTLDGKLAELKEAKQMHQNSHHKIQKVAEYLRNRKHIDKQYSPKLLSIGPIHLDNPNLMFGENYKLTWAAKYIQSTQQTPESLLQKIADNINELKGLYSDDVLALANTAASLKDFHSLEEKLSWLLFVDGCSLLYILEKLRLYQPNQQNEWNTNADQIGEREHVSINVDDEAEGHLNIKADQLVLVKMDVLLLENQLPYLVLKLLWRNDNDNELIDTMKNYLKIYDWATPDKKTWRLPDNQETNEPPTHLLDLQRKIILKTEDKNKANKKNQSGKSSKHSRMLMTYRNIEDLTTIGIKLESSGTRRLTDVDFSEGWFSAKLTLPQIVVDETTSSSFLNLIAYEMCPDFNNDCGICSFVVFLDSLIDHAEDVKKLRSEGILANGLGNDEEVADLFHKLSTDLTFYGHKYSEVRAKIHKHRFNKSKIWLALGYHTYFSNPWAITGFLAAFMALSLTFAQTWFSIFPR